MTVYLWGALRCAQVQARCYLNLRFWHYRDPHLSWVRYNFYGSYCCPRRILSRFLYSIYSNRRLRPCSTWKLKECSWITLSNRSICYWIHRLSLIILACFSWIAGKYSCWHRCHQWNTSCAFYPTSRFDQLTNGPRYFGQKKSTGPKNSLLESKKPNITISCLIEHSCS